MKDTWLKKWLKRAFYRPVIRIKRFIDYAPLIWRDEDYDGAYILKMLKYKIGRTRMHIASHKLFEGYEACVADMSEAETIIDRILEENWLVDEMTAHYEKYSGAGLVGESTHDKPEGREFRAIQDRIATLQKADYLRGSRR